MALKRSGLQYQRRILAEMAMPESLEDDSGLVAEELQIISSYINRSFEELGLVSYADKVFIIVHKLGMLVVVSFVLSIQTPFKKVSAF